MSIDWTKEITSAMKAEEAEAALEAQFEAVAKQRATELAQRKAADELLDTLPDEDVETLTYLYPRWEPGLDVAVDDKLRHEGILYKVIQPHTTQADWAPPQVPALFVRFREPTGGVMEWVAGEEVAVGDRRTYQGTTYEALQAHTTQAGWEPDATPSLWVQV